METSAGLPEGLVAWIADATGATVGGATRLPGGNRRQAWLVDLCLRNGMSEPVFLRFDPDPPPEIDDPYSLWREAQICRVLHAAGVLLPEVLSEHPTEQALLAQRVPGEASYYRLRDEQQRTAVARDFMHRLAELHGVDPRGKQVPGAADCTSLRCAVSAELDRWESMYRRTKDLDPLIEFGLSWLRRRVPDPSDRVAVVHGDAGPGNFLFVGARVTAIIDWELAHLGDPMEDLAWLALRTAQEGFPGFADRLDDYVCAGGTQIDVPRIRYHLIFAELRVVIIRHRARDSGPGQGDLGNSLLSAGLHRRLCVEALLAATGVPYPETPALPAVQGAYRWVADSVLELLREDIVGASTDPFVIARAKGAVRAVKVLRSDREYGPAAEHADLADLGAVLGNDVESCASGRRMLAERIRRGAVGSLDEGLTLDYLARMVGRETQVLRDALGALATRHHPALN